MKQGCGIKYKPLKLLLYYVASVRFAVGVHEVPPHLCALAVTYKPYRMQRGYAV